MGKVQEVGDEHEEQKYLIVFEHEGWAIVYHQTSGKGPSLKVAHLKCLDALVKDRFNKAYFGHVLAGKTIWGTLASRCPYCRGAMENDQIFETLRNVFTLIRDIKYDV